MNEHGINRVDAEALPQAFGNFSHGALCGQTFVTTKTPWCCPWIASATISSAPPFTVHLRGVNQAHAKLDSQTQRCDFPGTRTLLLSPMCHAPYPH